VHDYSRAATEQRSMLLAYFVKAKAARRLLETFGAMTLAPKWIPVISDCCVSETRTGVKCGQKGAPGARREGCDRRTPTVFE